MNSSELLAGIQGAAISFDPYISGPFLNNESLETVAGIMLLAVELVVDDMELKIWIVLLQQLIVRLTRPIVEMARPREADLEKKQARS